MKKSRFLAFYWIPVVFILLAFLGGCSRYNPPPRQQSYVPRAALPEVTPAAPRQTRRVPPKRVITSTVVQQARPHPTRPHPARPKPPKKPAVTIQRYSDKPKQTVITQTEAQAVLTPREMENPQPVQSEPDPYENIPENAGQHSAEGSSPAVKSLMLRARADLAMGNEQSAMSKLERALRIEPSNAAAWYLLAKAHQSSGEHQQAITMAKKAISYAGADEAMAVKSWKLIKRSGEESGDTQAVQEAINYSKVNP